MLRPKWNILRIVLTAGIIVYFILVIIFERSLSNESNRFQVNICVPWGFIAIFISFYIFSEHNRVKRAKQVKRRKEINQRRQQLLDDLFKAKKKRINSNILIVSKTHQNSLMLHIKRTALVLIPFGFLLTGCLTARKLDKQVAKDYSDRVTLVQMPQNTDLITISSPLIDQSEFFSTTKTSTSKMLPLVVYWSWEYKNASKLNPRIPINMLAGQLKKSIPLKDKLAGRKLELSVEQVPTNFAIVDKAHLIFFLYAFGWDNVSIQGEATNFVVKYKLYQTVGEPKSGEINVPVLPNMRGIGMFTSWKTATADFLQQYDANIAAMSKSLITGLMKEL